MKNDEADDLLPEYDFENMPGGVQGKHTAACAQGTNLLRLDTEVADACTPEESVKKQGAENATLRIDHTAQNGTPEKEQPPQSFDQPASPPERLGDLCLSLFGASRGADLEIPPREPHEPIDLKS